MPGRAEVLGYVTTGQIALDGKRLIRLDNGATRSRHRMNQEGAAVATLVLDRNGSLLAEPKVSLMGLQEGEDDEERSLALAETIEEAVERLPKASRRDDDSVREAARLAVRRAIRTERGKKPLIEIHLVRI